MTTEDSAVAKETGVANDTTGDTGEDKNVEPTSHRRSTRWVPRFGRQVTAPLLVLLIVAAAASAGWVYWYRYRADQQIVMFTRDQHENSPAAKAALTAAADGSVALLSYAPDSVDKDFASAKAHLTGDFLTYYSKFSEQIVAPAAKQKGVKTSATVVQSAISELQQDSAVVLLFLNQTTTSNDRPEPSVAASSVVVRLAKVNGNWLIAKFDPV